MDYRYAPEMDAEDAFDIDQEVIDSILESFDIDGYDWALDYASHHGLSSRRVDDLLEWFGRK